MTEEAPDTQLEIGAFLAKHEQRAAETLVDMMNQRKRQSVAMEAAKLILALRGHVTPDKGAQTIINVFPEKIKWMQTVAAELDTRSLPALDEGADAADVEDIDAVERTDA